MRERMPESVTSVALSVEAFRLLLDHFQRPLTHFARGLVGNSEDVHDIVQDVFVDAWRAVQRRVPPFTDGGNTRAVRNWLYHAAYCKAVSVLRHRGVIVWESLAIFDLDENFEPCASAPFEDRVLEGETLRAALATLESADIACLRLSVVEDFTSVEMAQILDIAPDAARKRLSRAMHRLRAAYFAEEDLAQERSRQ